MVLFNAHNVSYIDDILSDGGGGGGGGGLYYTARAVCYVLLYNGATMCTLWMGTVLGWP